MIRWLTSYQTERERSLRTSTPDRDRPESRWATQVRASSYLTNRQQSEPCTRKRYSTRQKLSRHLDWLMTQTSKERQRQAKRSEESHTSTQLNGETQRLSTSERSAALDAMSQEIFALPVPGGRSTLMMALAVTLCLWLIQ